MVGLGKSKLPILSTVSGGDPLLRAQVALKTEAETRIGVSNQILNEAEQRQLTALLEEFSDILRERPGRTGNCKHMIDTVAAAPVKVRPHRLPPRWEEEINTQQDEMLAHNICRPRVLLGEQSGFSRKERRVPAFCY